MKLDRFSRNGFVKGVKQMEFRANADVLAASGEKIGEVERVFSDQVHLAVGSSCLEQLPEYQDSFLRTPGIHIKGVPGACYGRCMTEFAHQHTYNPECPLK